MTLFEAILLGIAALVVWGIVSGKIDTKKLKASIADLRDDGKLNNSNAQPAVVVNHAEIVSAALEGAAAVTAAAQPKPAPIAAPAPIPVALPMRLEDVHDQGGLDSYRAYLARTNPGMLVYTPTVYAPPAAPGMINPPPSLPQAGPFPSAHLRGRAVCALLAGAQYRCYFPEAAGYMISVEQGRGARILAWQEGTPRPGWDQAAVDAATIAAAAGTAWLVEADKDCVVNMDG